eukprot:3520423-Amphidinium_carterae.1
MCTTAAALPCFNLLDFQLLSAPCETHHQEAPGNCSCPTSPLMQSLACPQSAAASLDHGSTRVTHTSSPEALTSHVAQSLKLQAHEATHLQDVLQQELMQVNKTVRAKALSESPTLTEDFPRPILDCSIVGATEVCSHVNKVCDGYLTASSGVQ